MYSQLMIHEMVDAVQRERQMADAPHTGQMVRSNSGLAVGAQELIGGALVRAGRFLRGSTAPRPEPIGS